MSYPGGILKRWNGSAWVGAAKLKFWNGAEWEQKAFKRWDGANWLSVDIGMTVPADASGAFVIAGTYTTLDFVQTSGTFNIAGTYTVA